MVLDPVSTFKISDGTDVIVREITSSVVVNSGLYNIIDRRTVSKIMEEQEFARSGLMDETQAAEIGKLAGAQSVLFSVLAKSGTKSMLTTKLIDVYSGRVEKQKHVLLDHSVDLVTEVETLTKYLVGGITGHTYTYSSHSASTQSSNASYGSPATNRQNQTITVNGVSFTMVYVEGGSFMMGCTSEQSGCYSDESPSHRVKLNSFYMGETEVTQELWRAVMGDNPSLFKGDKLPVEMVSWDDCV